MPDPAPTLGDPGERDRWREALLGALALLAAGQDLAGDPLTLAGIVAATWRRAYEATLRQELARAGQPVPDTLLVSNPEVTAAIDEHAAETARGIDGTLRSEAAHHLAGLPDRTPSRTVGRLLTTWLVARSVHKLAQVAVTETATAVGHAQREFIRRSKATGTATFGGSEKCALCQKVAGDNPYDIADPMVGVLPHVQCLDTWQTHYQSIDTPWHGQ